MPVPKPTSSQLKDKEGEKSFISSCMGNETMVNDYDNQKQRYAICKYSYDRAKQKHAKGTLAAKINTDAVIKASIKIKTNKIKESKEYVDTKELAAAYFEKNGIRKYKEWFLSIDPNEDADTVLAYQHPITSDFENLDIKSLENIMNLAAAVNDKDLANQAAALMETALKKQNGVPTSEYRFHITESGATLEASI